jgi:hypothetical protein
MNRKQIVSLAGIALAVLCGQGEAMEMKQPPYVWPSELPEDCPFEPSTEFDRVVIMPEHRHLAGGDTWYPSWASDGHLYSGWTDGGVAGMSSDSARGADAVTAAARLIGDDPMQLQVENLSLHKSSALPYSGRYPSAYLVHDGVFYLGTYCLDVVNHPDYPHRWGAREGCPTLCLKHPFRKGPDIEALNYPYLGPFVGFRTSTDFGKTWTETPHTPDAPLFPEDHRPFDRTASFSRTKIGSPHVVDFGKNMEHSPDGKVYLVAHGALDDDADPRPHNASWINGDAVYLLRVPPGIDTMNDPAAYEFFAGHDASGAPIWSGQWDDMKPLLEWDDNMGCVTITYNAPLKRYLMAVTDGTDTLRPYNSYILEAPDVTGPWKLVTYMKNFGEQAYFITFPGKFIGGNGTDLWMMYSGNYANYFGIGLKPNLPGSRYGLVVQKIKLLRPGEDF